jgi:peptide/nickel transport system permease protein
VLDESSFPKDEEGVRPEAWDAAPRWELWPYCRYGPRTETRAILQPASLLHPLGTDERGRDVFARLIHGARVTLLTGLSVVLIGAIGGVFAGGLAGGFPGAGRFTQRRRLSCHHRRRSSARSKARLGARQSSAPRCSNGLSRGSCARVERLAAEDCRSRALGATRREVLTRHVLPHLGPTLAASAALGLSAVVVLESTLSFLGLGAPISSASWGEMMAEGARNPQQLGLFWAPLVLLSLTVGSAYLIAEAVRSVSDPRTTHRDAPAVADRA